MWRIVVNPVFLLFFFRIEVGGFVSILEYRVEVEIKNFYCIVWFAMSRIYFLHVVFKRLEETEVMEV